MHNIYIQPSLSYSPPKMMKNKMNIYLNRNIKYGKFTATVKNTQNMRYEMKNEKKKNKKINLMTKR